MLKNIIIFGVVVITIAVFFLYMFRSNVWYKFNSYNLQSDISTDTDVLQSGIDFDFNSLFYSACDQMQDIGEGTDHIVVLDVSAQKEYIFTKDGSIQKIYKVSTGSSVVLVEHEDSDEEEVELESEDRSMGVSVWKVRYKTEYSEASYCGSRIMMLDRYVAGSWIQTDVALHGTNRPDLLGTPWSLGCVYHDNADIIELYDLIDVGTFVVAIE